MQEADIDIDKLMSIADEAKATLGVHKNFREERSHAMEMLQTTELNLKQLNARKENDSAWRSQHKALLNDLKIAEKNYDRAKEQTTLAARKSAVATTVINRVREALEEKSIKFEFLRGF